MPLSPSRVARAAIVSLATSLTTNAAAPAQTDFDPYFTPTAHKSTSSMPRVIIRNIREDDAGNIWFATFGGPIRYDGTQFANFGNEVGLPRRRIFSMHVDRKGALWFGSITAGVSRYDGVSATRWTKAAPSLPPAPAQADDRGGLVDDDVLWIFEDRDGALWFGTARGLTRLEGDVLTTFTTADGLLHDAVYAIAQDPSGRLWIGTQGGICSFDGETFDDLADDVGLLTTFVGSLLVDRDGDVWFGHPEPRPGVGGGGATRFDGTSFEHVTREDGLTCDAVYCLFEDRDGNIWFGSFDDGACRYDGERFVDFSDPVAARNAATATPTFRLKDTVVRRIHEDRRGTLWLGTNGRGVVRVDDGTARYLSTDDGFGGHAVRAIEEDENGDVWFGTSGGLTRYDGEDFTTFTTKDGLVADDVWCVEIGRDGTIWVGTMDGVSRFDGREFTPFEIPATKTDPNRGVGGPRMIRSILEDRDGSMWFATNGGALVWDGETSTRLTTADGLSDDAVNHILQADDGSMWFATHYGGVCRWDGTTFTRIGGRGAPTGDEAWALFEDRAGNVWFSIEHDGVYRHDGNALTRFHTQAGLACDAVQSIFEDARGALWFGGWMALYRFDGTTFVSHAN